jgi:hypothetical protein
VVKEDIMSVDTIIENVTRQVNAPVERAKPARRDRKVEERTWTLPGFGPLTRITTSFGETPAQALRTGDLVRTRRGDFKPIAWLDRLVLDEEFISLHPDSLPVVIGKGALGRGMPSADVHLAPCQPIDAAANRLGPRHDNARALLGRPGVLRKAEAMYTYTLFHLGAPEVIRVSGMFVRIDP